MTYAEHLKNLLRQRGMTATELSQISGIGKSSISQYLSGKNVPNGERRKLIDKLLRSPEEYEDDWENLKVADVAAMLHTSQKSIQRGLQQGRFPWGYAVMGEGQWTYIINSRKFRKHEMFELPEKGGTHEHERAV